VTSNLDQARATLRANDRGGYTVPNGRIYPFQWNWDSAFVAMGWATFDAARAWREVETLLEGQWDDGMIPQIVFHAASDDYFPGPDVWGTTPQSPRTSGITQPPVLATAARAVFDADPAGEDRMATIYKRLLRNHRWWERARDPARRGLVATLHPWETGMDNSPAWDLPLQRVPTTTETKIVRRDTAHVDPAMRPRQEDYARFIHLVDHYRNCGWDPARMLATTPFKVADIGTNAILLRAERDLRELARRFGSPADQAEIGERVERMARAIPALWHDPLGLFVSRDLLREAPIPVGTSAGLLPPYAGVGLDHLAPLCETLARWAGTVRFLVPSTDPADPAFEKMRYWRGPVWAVVNWMIADGLGRAGQHGWADRIRADTRICMEGAGFSEYFDPVTGHGLGGADFSWTAAIGLLLAEGRHAASG